MQSHAGRFAPDGAPHSYFCVHDAGTGEAVTCPPTSSGFAFFEAIVDHTVPDDQVVWVFGSAWDRANSSVPGCKPWGCGACAQGHCYVGAWSSRDLVTWEGPAAAVVLPPNVTVPNVGTTMVSRPGNSPPLPPGLPAHQAFMVLEATPMNNSGWGRLMAVNVGADRDLSRNWLLLDFMTHAMDGPGVGQAGSCPATRFNPADGYYYVLGGGNNVDLTRSANLSRGSWEAPPPPLGAFMETGCIHGAEDCGPTSPVARIAAGWYTHYWANGSDRGDRVFLSNLTDWNWSVNDADFCDSGGSAPTYFIYGQCLQTAPANFTGRGGNFYQVGVANMTELDWLASYYGPARAGSL